jgi:hypothetical protein
MDRSFSSAAGLLAGSAVSFPAGTGDAISFRFTTYFSAGPAADLLAGTDSAVPFRFITGPPAGSPAGSPAGLLTGTDGTTPFCHSHRLCCPTRAAG